MAKEIQEWMREAAAIIVAGENRCPECLWPLAKSEYDGCVIGNCSYRPDDAAEHAKRMTNRQEWEKVTAIIASHAPEGTDQWVPVKERLPAEGSGCLYWVVSREFWDASWDAGYFRGSDCRGMLESERTDGQNDSIWYGEGEVSHWMIPAPPNAKPVAAARPNKNG